MKKNLWLVIGLSLSTSLLAQQLTNPPPSAPIQSSEVATNPAPVAVEVVPVPAVAATNAVPKKAPETKASKKAIKKAAPSRKTSLALDTKPLVPGPAVVVASNVNIRGQAKLRSEVVGRVTKAQEVTVMAEIVRNNSAEDEPSAWAKIVLPAQTPVWVSSLFLSNNVVVPQLLNVRGGPGENYSVLGTITRGTTVAPISTKGDWTQIQTPEGVFGFVAAQFLKQEAASEIALVTPPVKETPPAPVMETSATSETITEAPVIAAAPSDVPTPVAAPPVVAAESQTNLIASATSPDTDTMTEDEETIDEPLPKRIVQREGVVRGTASIQAPSHFALISPETGKLIDYLYSSSPGLDLRRYKGLRIIVTGEEALEERWGNTPVITIQKIDVLDE